uniref:(northern house mosquito) hypothetical protein n=1 Tax=Culex pipiens TaxID=7175 RepID=A0A8D8E6J1_CULPI
MSSRDNLPEGTGHSKLWPTLSKWPFSSPVSKSKKFDTHIVQSRMALHRNTPEGSGHSVSCGQNIPAGLPPLGCSLLQASCFSANCFWASRPSASKSRLLFTSRRPAIE